MQFVCNTSRNCAKVEFFWKLLTRSPARGKDCGSGWSNLKCRDDGYMEIRIIIISWEHGSRMYLPPPSGVYAQYPLGNFN